MYLNYCGLEMPYGDTDLSQHWLWWWLGAWWHQAITWTNIVSSTKLFCGIHLRAISQIALMKSIHNNICSEITVLKLLHISRGEWVAFLRVLSCPCPIIVRVWYKIIPYTAYTIIMCGWWTSMRTQLAVLTTFQFSRCTSWHFSGR